MQSLWRIAWGGGGTTVRNLIVVLESRACVPQVLEHPTSMRDLPPIERSHLVAWTKGRLQLRSELARPVLNHLVATTREAEDARIAAPASMSTLGGLLKVTA